MHFGSEKHKMACKKKLNTDSYKIILQLEIEQNGYLLPILIMTNESQSENPLACPLFMQTTEHIKIQCLNLKFKWL